MKRSFAVVVFLALMLGSSVFVGNAFAIQKYFTAEISPKAAFAQQTNSYTITIVNDASNPNGNKLGSTIIDIPPGFTNVIVTDLFSSQKRWLFEVTSTQIKLTARASADCLSPEKSIIVYFDAKAPSTIGIYAWNTCGFTSPSWAGDLFTLKSAPSLLQVQVITSPSYTVTFGSEVVPDGVVVVTYNIDDKLNEARLTPFLVEVETGHKIYYSYPASVSDDSGNLYTLTGVNPSSPFTVTEDITVVGSYEKSFEIVGSSGGNIQATTDSSASSTVFGLPEIPGGVIGSYFFVTIQATLSGTFEIAVHYNVQEGFPEEELRLYMGDLVDFNGDGKVDGHDIDEIQTFIKSHGFSEKYDINHDGEVDRTDLAIVQEYASKGLLIPTSYGDPGQTRLPWIDITTWIDTENDIIYGETDHFSGFGVHR